jgi:hypothetical protein
MSGERRATTGNEAAERLRPFLAPSGQEDLDEALEYAYNRGASDGVDLATGAERRERIEESAQ